MNVSFYRSIEPNGSPPLTFKRSAELIGCLAFHFVERYTVDNLPSLKATAINRKYVVVILLKIPHPGWKQRQTDLIRTCDPFTLPLIRTWFVLENSHQISKPRKYTSCGEQGWCRGENTRLPPMWPKFNSSPETYVCCWFLPNAKRVFLWLPLVFSSLHKNQHLQIPIWPG